MFGTSELFLHVYHLWWIFGTIWVSRYPFWRDISEMASKTQVNYALMQFHWDTKIELICLVSSRLATKLKFCWKSIQLASWILVRLFRSQSHAVRRIKLTVNFLVIQISQSYLVKQMFEALWRKKIETYKKGLTCSVIYRFYIYNNNSMNIPYESHPYGNI